LGKDSPTGSYNGFVPRKPTLSPSKITTYLACPVKYKWTYIDERGKWYLKSKSFYSFGSSLHRVLQRFHDEGDQGVATVHEAVAALEEGWVEAGYASQEEMTQAMAEGKAIIADYIDRVSREPVTSRTLFIEKTIRMDFGDFVLMGRLDRLDEREDGALEVIDYKSGRMGVQPEDVKGDLAMSLYQLLVKGQHPDRPVVATIIALRAGSRASASLADDELDELRANILELGQEILFRDYEALIPVGKPLCHRCDFLPLCRKHPDFELPPQEPEIKTSDPEIA
jgi:putative RecB family exonuclease